MSTIQDMQDKTVEVNLAGQKFIAHQLFIEDWAKVEAKIKGTTVSINDILSGEVSIIGYRSVVEVAINSSIPSKVNLQELFRAAGDILNLDVSADESPVPNAQAAPETI